MQEDRPRRGQRRKDNVKQIGIQISNFKDFLNSKLEFKIPQGFATFPNEQKIETWKGLLDRLKNQTEKLSYQFPDYWKQEEVNLIMKTIDEENQDQSLDYEYEQMFLGNKKQLVIYKKCRQMDEYLEKYRLPKNYDPFLKEVENVAKVIFELKIKRNIAISLGNKEQLDQLNSQIAIQGKMLDEKFKKFEDLMRKIFEHFKQQKKRTVINIEIIRESIYEKLKPLATELELNIFPRYPDIDNQEFLFIQVTKKNEFDKYFDSQNLDEDENDNEEIVSNDQSSEVSDESEQERELQAEEKKRKALPPSGVYSIRFEKYQKSILTLRISFETSRNKFETPQYLEYSLTDAFENSIQILNSMIDLFVNLPVTKRGFICSYFRTKNDFGFSQMKKFKYFLNLDQEMNMVKNGSFYLIGQDKYLIPQQRTRKENNLNLLTLAVSDFSISSTQVEICDSDGNSADWGLFKRENDKKQEVVEENAVFRIVNNANNMFYQEPAIRLQKSYQIVKCSSGAGYGMLLDAYGAVWVFGKNNCGQLGMKEEMVDDEPVKIKFFEEGKIFITDIKATQSLSSFAIDSNGTLYRWGLNQFHSTNEPIYDRFGKIINYSLSNYFQQQWTPIPIKKHFETQKIVQIAAGNQFYFILNNEGTLYGWGQCRNLGKGIMNDGKDEEIENICNDIELMKNVHKIAAGKDHAIAITKSGQVLGWGKLESLTKQKTGFSQNIVNLTEEYGKISPKDIIACGSSYTCLYKAEEKKIVIFGGKCKFSLSQFEIKQKVRKIECGENVIGLLVQKEDTKNL